MRASVQVADEQPWVAEILGQYLSAFFDVCPPIASLDNIAAEIQRYSPDVLLLSVDFRDGSTLSLLEFVKARFPMIHILVLATRADSTTIDSALRKGADGYVLKDESPTTIPLVIRAVLQARPVPAGLQNEAPTLPPTVSPVVKRWPAPAEIPMEWGTDVYTVMRVCGFTRVLAEVAVLRHHGLTVKAISGRLGISLHTVRARFRRIYDRHKIRGIAEVMLVVERALGGRSNT